MVQFKPGLSDKGLHTFSGGISSISLSRNLATTPWGFPLCHGDSPWYSSISEWITFCIQPCQLGLQNIPTAPLRRGKTLTNEYRGYDTKLRLMVRLHFRILGKRWVPLHCYYFQDHSLLEWKYLLGFHLSIKSNYLIIYYAWNHLCAKKKWDPSHLKNLLKKSFDKCINWIWHSITIKGWYAIKSNTLT